MGSTMSAVVAETVDGARAQVVVDGYPVEFVAESIHDAIHQVQRRAVALARERQAPVTLTAQDPVAVHHLLVSPEGQIVAAPAEDAAKPALRLPGFLRRGVGPDEPAAVLTDAAQSDQGPVAESPPEEPPAAGSLAVDPPVAEPPTAKPQAEEQPAAEPWVAGPLSSVAAAMASPPPARSASGPVSGPPADPTASTASTGAHWGEGAPSTFLPDPTTEAPPAPEPPKKSLFGSLGARASRQTARDEARRQAPAEPMTFGVPRSESLSDAQLLRRRHAKPATIAVVNPKGGAGKTPLTLMLAAAFAQHTNGVLAWDNNPFRGTLGWRVEPADHGGTVGSLLADLDELEARELRLSDIDAYVHPQEDGVDVLPGDPMAIETGTVGGVQVERLWAHVSRYYRVLVMDSGNDERSPGWQSMIARADQIVVVSSTRYEVAEAARLMLDSLSRGDEHTRRLARSAVAVVSQANPDEDIERDPSLATARQIADGFAYLARASVVVPYDPAVASIRLRWQALAPATRAAVTRAAALVAAGLPAR